RLLAADLGVAGTIDQRQGMPLVAFLERQAGGLEIGLGAQRRLGVIGDQPREGAGGRLVMSILLRALGEEEEAPVLQLASRNGDAREELLGQIGIAHLVG